MRKLVALASAALLAVALGQPGAAAQQRTTITREAINPGDRDVLLVIDVQNCFLPGGTLPVPDGDKVIPVINRLAPAFRNIVVTQDWHTKNHISFASSHPGKRPYDKIHVPYGTQVLWPDHCVQGTSDAALTDKLHLPQAQLIIRKGYRQNVDSYSAFLEADHTPTGLIGYLEERGAQNIYLVGLATDFCVAWSALDARHAGFKPAVIEDGTRGINTSGSLEEAWTNMARAAACVESSHPTSRFRPPSTRQRKFCKRCQPHHNLSLTSIVQPSAWGDRLGASPVMSPLLLGWAVA
ncbi:nicotinamidase [Streptomyces sp. 900105245]